MLTPFFEQLIIGFSIVFGALFLVIGVSALKDKIDRWLGTE